ncbi:MAG: glycosyltransferase [Chloroflexi bacterium]|nr:glycosyltransferase [Chloroflexota bacterium]
MSRRVALILTVLNEIQTIGPLLDSLAAQTRRPDEVVVVDGGSTDGTWEFLQEYKGPLPLRALRYPGANISQGRNKAIQATQAEIIVSTDAGVRLAPTWLERLLAPWSEDTPPAVAGFFLPDPQTPFELALAATTLPLPEEIAPERFLPSSRSVAFLREVWERVGGYPEWLDYSEDVVFDLRVRALAGPFAWAPDAVVYFRPRSSLGAFFRQYRNYAFGDGQADLWRMRHALRYLIYGIFLPALLYLGGTGHVMGWMLLLIGAGLYVRRPWWRLGRLAPDLPFPERLRIFLWVPLLRVVGDVAKMWGYPRGLLWRWRHRRDPAIHWRRDLPRPVGGTSGGRVI